MDLSDELFERALIYTSSRSSLTELDRWISDHLTEFVETPHDDEGGMLWSFIQVRDGVLAGQDACLQHRLELPVGLRRERQRVLVRGAAREQPRQPPEGMGVSISRRRASIPDHHH
jgi:hypothetical protein